jgi:polysaccharide export outer membrane protein
VGPGDVLKVTVWGHDSLTRTDTVSPEGVLPFPLIGEVRVSGLSIAEVEARIRGLLDRDYIIDPRVSVAVQEYRSQRVFVLGEVAKPGVYPLTGATSLLDVLSQAGGQTAVAGGSIMVTRPSAANGPPPGAAGEVLRVNLRKLLDGDPASNLRLQHSDTVFVPRLASFFVLGEVQRQGGFALERETTVLDAISLAGGFTGRAAPRGAKILRKQPDGPLTTIELDLSGPDSRAREVSLKDGDTLLVPAGDLFFVLGEVAKPGAFTLVGATTVIDGVLLAGGFTPKASESKVRVTRRLPTGEEQVMVLDLSVPNARGRDIPLMAGDTVMVPTGTGATVYVLGEVKSPGAFPLQDGATTIQAIALAGGFTDRAAAGRVRIIRTREDGKQEIKVMDANDVIKRGRKDKDVPLAANDVVVVPESLF